jgi:hypothetical protein
MAGRFSLESRTLEQPGSVRQWMQSFDLTLFCGEAQRFRADAEEGRALRQVHPTFGLTRFGMTDGDFVVAAKRRHPFARPTIAMPGTKIIAVPSFSAAC